MRLRTKVLRTTGVLAALAALAASGVFSAFSSQTDSPGNVVTAGSVTLSDNDAGGALFDGTLASFASAHDSYASGLADNPGTSATKWVADDAVVYRVTATLSASAPDGAQGQTTGTHALRWEAQSQ